MTVRALPDASDPALRLSTAADTAELATLRKSVRDFLATHDVPDDAMDDVELAVSELATNVILHTDATSISVVVTRAGDQLVLDVADGDDVPPLDSIEMPPADQVTGRGLFVVEQVMDELGIVEIDGARVVRCRRSLST
jgi:serine/threonine-protein kinase RsbW